MNDKSTEAYENILSFLKEIGFSWSYRRTDSPYYLIGKYPARYKEYKYLALSLKRSYGPGGSHYIDFRYGFGDDDYNRISIIWTDWDNKELWQRRILETLERTKKDYVLRLKKERLEEFERCLL